jgi:hypothetical protein
MHARQAARPNTHGSMIWANPAMTDDPVDSSFKFILAETTF